MNVRRRDEMTSITEQTSRQKDRQQVQQSNATNAGDGFGGIISFRYQNFCTR